MKPFKLAGLFFFLYFFFFFFFFENHQHIFTKFLHEIMSLTVGIYLLAHGIAPSERRRLSRAFVSAWGRNEPR